MLKEYENGVKTVEKDATEWLVKRVKDLELQKESMKLNSGQFLLSRFMELALPSFQSFQRLQSPQMHVTNSQPSLANLHDQGKLSPEQ